MFFNSLPTRLTDKPPGNRHRRPGSCRAASSVLSKRGARRRERAMPWHCVHRWRGGQIWPAHGGRAFPRPRQHNFLLPGGEGCGFLVCETIALRWRALPPPSVPPVLNDLAVVKQAVSSVERRPKGGGSAFKSRRRATSPRSSVFGPKRHAPVPCGANITGGGEKICCFVSGLK